MMTLHRVPPVLLKRARDLRREMTFPESKLWHHLKMRKLLGLKFRKQHPIEPFIADFYCAELDLIVEVDGQSHVDAVYDEWRTCELQMKGISVIRFTNDEVLYEIEAVLERIADWATRSGWSSPHPPPSPP